MKYQQFTAPELYVMARIRRKRAMYGIPDVFEMIDDDDRLKAILDTEEKLIDKQIAIMDIDGRISLSEEYYSIVDMICGCEKCLTVNYQFGPDRAEDVILWKSGDQLLRADVIGDGYVFIWDDALSAEAYLSTLCMNGLAQTTERPVTIPNIALTRAKRAALDGNEEECQRILLQNGAGASVEFLTASISERADYLCLVLMENASDGFSERKAAWLGYGGTLSALAEDVVNFRDCTKFIPCGLQAIEQEIRSFVQAFL